MRSYLSLVRYAVALFSSKCLALISLFFNFIACNYLLSSIFFSHVYGTNGLLRPDLLLDFFQSLPDFGLPIVYCLVDPSDLELIISTCGFASYALISESRAAFKLSSFKNFILILIQI